MKTETLPFKEIKRLLDEGYNVEIDSPDGFVPVDKFIEKGEWEEYVLVLDDGRRVRVNGEHLFETGAGWVHAGYLAQIGRVHFKTDNGMVMGEVKKTGFHIPIVDLHVNHPNHRYYANGVSSHNTGVGKTLFMCHMAAHNFLSGLNVLYITMEMSEERIAQRIDANLLDIDINDLETTDRHEFDLRLDRIRQKSPGRLVIKEFGTGAGNVSHFRHLLTELSLKKHFKPDIIYVDYLNICASARYTSRDANSYMIVKAIAEELRGLAVEYDVPVVSATQFNRTGAGSSDPGMTDTSDSFGTPMTADLQFAIMQPEELAEEGKIVVKQLKNRYAPLEDHRRFYLGVDKSRMRVMNCDDAFSNDNPTRTGAPSPAASGHIGTGKPSAKVDSSGFDFSDDGEDE